VAAQPLGPGDRWHRAHRTERLVTTGKPAVSIRRVHAEPAIERGTCTAAGEIAWLALWPDRSIATTRTFPMTDAPSWYVFSSDAYRIPGEGMPQVFDVRSAQQPHPLPVAKGDGPAASLDGMGGVGDLDPDRALCCRRWLARVPFAGTASLGVSGRSIRLVATLPRPRVLTTARRAADVAP
jgi:hypothetical protein